MIKCKEIFKLKSMLEKEEISFDWIPNWGYDLKQLEEMKKISPDLVEHYQICYPSKGKNQWISVIGGFGVYGEREDKLEIMGGFTPYEKDTIDDSVIGYLTAENVYNRIQAHYENEKRKELIKMEKTVKYVDENTLELKETIIEEKNNNDVIELLRQALVCEPKEFRKKYNKFKEAEAAFNAIYEPFKENLIKLHEEKSDLPKSIIISGIRCTYISPSVRKSIDTKKLKEEEPELAKKYTKTSNVKSSVKIEDITPKVII